MNHRKVRDLMNDAVVSVQRGTPFKEIAHLLQEYDITAVPVVDGDDRPVGVVSEADLLHKLWDQLEPAGLRESRPDGSEDAAEAGKALATDAEGLMTSPVVCARADWSVVEAARAMAEHKVKRLLVVDETQRLIGVISRSDLLRVFLRKDQAIRTEILEEIVVKTLGALPSAVNVEVNNGHVILSGHVSRTQSVALLEELCRHVDGVVAVVSRLESMARH
ncbi:CBS domain-containing protein [Streptomyces sp. NPDC012935]|uniref:CBS domain-containing protein n=1 Tax=Streptomyces sp. NPDC012935 TaxID=3364857 RepID=UPI0036A4AADA